MGRQKSFESKPDLGFENKFKNFNKSIQIILVLVLNRVFYALLLVLKHYFFLNVLYGFSKVVIFCAKCKECCFLSCVMLQLEIIVLMVFLSC